MNGTGRTGEALAARQGFEAAGFVVVGTRSAPPFGTVTTTVEHGPGEAAQAALVARHLPEGALVSEVPGPGITVVTGSDFAGVAPEARPDTSVPPPGTPPPPTTTTTISEEENLMRFFAGVGSAECYAG